MRKKPYQPPSLKKGYVFMKNGLFVPKKKERPFSLKGCSIVCKGLFVYQTAVIFLPEACNFSNGQL
jgi:hypothetical protein